MERQTRLVTEMPPAIGGFVEINGVQVPEQQAKKLYSLLHEANLAMSEANRETEDDATREIWKIMDEVGLTCFP